MRYYCAVCTRPLPDATEHGQVCKRCVGRLQGRMTVGRLRTLLANRSQDTPVEIVFRDAQGVMHIEDVAEIRPGQFPTTVRILATSY